MYNQITITPTELIVSPAGLDRLWALKGHSGALEARDRYLS